MSYDPNFWSNQSKKSTYDTLLGSINNYNTRLNSVGYTQQDAAKQFHWYSPILSILDILDRPRNAVVNAISDTQNGGDFGTGFMAGLTGAEHSSFSNVLQDAGVQSGFVRAVGGFAGDVLLDPNTYITAGLGGLAKGLVTGSGEAITKEAATKVATNTMLDGLNTVIKKAGTDMADDVARYGTLNTMGDAVKTIKNLKEASPNVFSKLIDTLSTDNVYKPVGAALQTFLGTPEVTDEATKLVSDALGNTAKLLGDNMYKNMNKATGLGLHLPFTNTGADLISGDKMRQAGAALSSKINAIPGLGKVTEGVQNVAGSLFDKYYLGKAGKTAEQYLKHTNVVRAGMTDWADEQQRVFIGKLINADKAFTPYAEDLNKIADLWVTDQKAAVQAVKDLPDSPFKTFVMTAGMYEGSPLKKIFPEYSKAIQGSVFTTMNEGEIDAYLTDGLAGYMQKDGSTAKALRYFGADLGAAGQSGSDYVVELNNVGTGVQGAFDKLQASLTGSPIGNSEKAYNFITPERTVNVYKINKDAKTAEEVLQNVTDDMIDQLHGINSEQFAEKGVYNRYFKKTISSVDYSSVTPYIKENEKYIFAPKMYQDGAVSKDVYTVFDKATGKAAGEMDITDIRAAAAKESAAKKTAQVEALRNGGAVATTTTAIPPVADNAPLDTSTLNKFGFKSYDEFVKATPAKNMDLSKLKTAYEGAVQGSQDASKRQAMMHILENSDSLYADAKTPEEQATKIMALMQQKSLLDAGMSEKNLGLLKAWQQSYVPHMENWDRLEAASGKFQKGGMSKSYNIFNPSDISRKYRMSVDEANVIFEQMGMGKNYFETDLTKAYMYRMLRHNKVLYDNQYIDRLMSGIGMDVSKEQSIQAIKARLKGSGVNPDDYTVVVPRSYLKLFQINAPEANTLDAMNQFVEKGGDFATMLKNMQALPQASKNADEIIKNVTGILNQAKSENKSISKSAEKALNDLIKNVSRESSNGIDKVQAALEKAVTYMDTAKTEKAADADLWNYIRKELNPQMGEMSTYNAQRSLGRAADLLDNVQTGIGETVSPEAVDYMKKLLEANNNDELNKVLEEIKGIKSFTVKDLDKLNEFGQIVQKIPKGTVTQLKDANRLKNLFTQLGDVRSGALAQVTDETMFHSLLGQVKDVKAFAIPTSVYNFVKKSSTGQLDEGMQNITYFLNKFNGLWKTSVTAMLPGAWIRNWFGGNMQNMFELGASVLDPKIQLASKQLASGMDGEVLLGGKKYTLQGIREEMQKTTVNTPFLRTELADMQNIYKTEYDRMTGASKLISKNPVKTWSNVGRAANNWVEDDVRSANFMAWLDKGFDAVSASERTKLAQFDYTELSQVEKKLFKQIMPFYTFFKNNFTYQITNFLNNPGSVMKLKHLTDNANAAQGVEGSTLPDYMQSQFSLALGKNAETGRVNYLNWNLPVQDLFGRSPRELLSGLNPLITMPIEAVTNQSLFTGQSISDYPGQKTQVGLPFTDQTVGVNNAVMNVVNKFAIVKNSMDTLNNLSTNDANKVLTPARAMSPTTLFGMIRGYSPQAGAISNMYDQQTELQNLIKMLQDNGVTVPTAAQLKKGSTGYVNKRY